MKNLNPRDKQVSEFLSSRGWSHAYCTFLSGDASFRSYDRVTLNDKTAVLMDAPPDKEPLKPFIKMANFLNNQGYSAPEIYGSDEENGFLLLEDLGDNLYSHVLKDAPAQEADLYLAAADFLIDLHKNEAEIPQIPVYDTELLLQETALFIDWYLAAALGREQAAKHRPEFIKIWSELFEAAPWLPNVLVLRDFHADNLLWLPEREGVAKVGLLDFQDAVSGSPVYDLVSFLEDARRDVQPETVMTVLNHYLQQMLWEPDAFMTCYALLGAQRNMKIVGIFTRLMQRDGKDHYLKYLPRVWNHLLQDLKHPILKPLNQWLERVLPEDKRLLPAQLTHHDHANEKCHASKK